MTCTYAYTGAVQTFTPPAGITALSIRVSGASGGDGSYAIDGGGGGPGGRGGTVTATLVGALAQLSVIVGGRGEDATKIRYNFSDGYEYFSGSQSPDAAGRYGYGRGGLGGTSRYGTKGGGAGGAGSAVMVGAVPMAIAAGGGGGGGGADRARAGGASGGAGGASSANGAADTELNGDGNPNGRGGVVAAGVGPDGAPGQINTQPGTAGGSGGGGGGGLAGGGGGQPGEAIDTSAGGGAGGTNLVPPGGQVTDGDNRGDGVVTISYTG